LNLIKHTLALTKVGGEKSKLKLIENRVKANPNVADLSWFEQKIEDLKA
jgi:hypothetical protein